MKGRSISCTVQTYVTVRGVIAHSTMHMYGYVFVVSHDIQGFGSETCFMLCGTHM